MPKLRAIEGGKRESIAETRLTFAVSGETTKAVDEFVLERAGKVFSGIADLVDLQGSKPVMSRDETKAFFKVSDATLNHYVDLGLKKHKIGNSVYYVRDECLNFIISFPGE